MFDTGAAPKSRLARSRRLARVFAAFLLVAASTLTSGSGARAADPVVLRLGTTFEQNTSNVNQCCMDFLGLRVGYNGLAAMLFGGGLGPEYAESWTTSADGLTWTFKIRPNMKWSDGEPADATDAAFTFNYMIDSIGDENELGQGFNNTYWWKDADGKSAIESVTTPDPLTLVVKTTVPLGTFLYNNYFVLPEHVWKDIPYAEAMTTFQTEPPIVGTGPFILTEWKHGQYVRLVRNEYYWGDRPEVDEILIITYKSLDAVVAALQAGEIDLANGIDANRYDTLAADPNLEVIAARTPWYTYLGFNTLGTAGGASNDAGADPAFREAINYAMDTATIVDKVYNGRAEPGVGVVAPIDTTFYTGLPDVIRPFDIDVAKQKLDAAGYPAGPDGKRLDKSGKPLELKLISGTRPDALATTQFVVGWLAALGIAVTPLALDDAAYNEVLWTTRAWDLDVGWHSTPGGPPSFSIHTPPDCTNCWAPDEYLDLYDQFIRATDPQTSVDLGHQLDQMGYEAAAEVVLAYFNDIQAHRVDTFTGWTHTPADGGPYFILDAFSSIHPFFTGLTLASSASPEPSSGGPTGPVDSGAPQASPGPDGTSGSGGSTTVLVAAAVLVVIIGGGLIWRRRRTT
jgi:peptide/nickel transport system substrate-binding protein